MASAADSLSTSTDSNSKDVLSDEEGMGEDEEQGAINIWQDVARAHFRGGNFAAAAACFKTLVKNAIYKYGTRAEECLEAFLNYGFASLYRFPVPANDPMALVRKEADYWAEASDWEPSNGAARQPSLGVDEDGFQFLDEAREVLQKALSIIENSRDLSYSMDKARILSALGEIAFRKGESNPQEYYLEAIPLLKPLPKDTILHRSWNYRIADIYYKICICFLSTDKKEAIAYCKKAISLYAMELQHYIPEGESSPDVEQMLNELKVIDEEVQDDEQKKLRSRLGQFLEALLKKENAKPEISPAASDSLNDTGSSFSSDKQKGERTMLIELLNDLLKKLDVLEQADQTSTEGSASASGNPGKIPTAVSSSGPARDDPSLPPADHTITVNAGVGGRRPLPSDLASEESKKKNK